MRLVIDCQEQPAEVMTELFSEKGKLGWFFFKEQYFNQIDTGNLPPIKLETNQKSPSERLRSVLFILWKSKNITQPFDNWYIEKMDEIINGFKLELPPL